MSLCIPKITRLFKSLHYLRHSPFEASTIFCVAVCQCSLVRRRSLSQLRKKERKCEFQLSANLIVEHFQLIALSPGLSRLIALVQLNDNWIVPYSCGSMLQHCAIDNTVKAY